MRLGPKDKHLQQPPPGPGTGHDHDRPFQVQRTGRPEPPLEEVRHGQQPRLAPPQKNPLDPHANPALNVCVMR